MSGKSGFSLMEVIVALAILAAAGVLVTRSLSASTGLAASSEDQVWSAIIAESVINDYDARDAFEVGIHQGKASRTYNWVMTVEEWKDSDAVVHVTMAVASNSFWGRRVFEFESLQPRGDGLGPS